MTHYIEHGDIFNLPGVTSYAHGCNCAGAMGKGIALQFKAKFPEMYNEYKHLCATGEFKPGDVYAYNHGQGFVYNLGTQVTWRTKAKLEYIGNALETMLNMAEADNITDIALPAIGAGLVGLLWDDVKNIINKAAERHPDVNLHIVEAYRKP